MYGLTRATTTLVFSAGAGLVIWFATQISNDNTGGRQLNRRVEILIGEIATRAATGAGAGSSRAR